MTLRECWNNAETILRWCWEDSERMLRWQWDNAEMTLRRRWDNDAETMMGWHWDDAETMLRWYWDNAERMLKQSLDDSEIILKRCWDSNETMPIICWDGAKTTLRQCWELIQCWDMTQWWHNTDTTAHCSLLDVYISQKTRLCAVNLEDQFQTCLVAKLINFLIWKFKSIILIFLLILAGVVKSSAFCTLLLLFQRVEVLKSQFDAKTSLKHFNLFEIALTVCKKHWIWQFLQKVEEKWE